MIRLSFIFLFTISTRLLFAQMSFEKVNSPYDEQNPVISPDGETLYCTIAFHPQNVGGDKDPGDIWVAKREGNSWSALRHGGNTINSWYYNAVAGFSVSGKQLYVMGQFENSAAWLASCNWLGNEWSKPLPITIPYFKNTSNTISGSCQEEVFIFSAQSYETYGAEDLYMTQLTRTGWTDPVNLGATINTGSQELTPFLLNGKTLYFSSNGRGGDGSFDIFMSEKLDDSWTNWSRPVSVNLPINTTGRELYFRVDPTSTFTLYTTTTNSDGYGDIRSIRLDKKNNQDSTSTKIFSGQVVSARTGVGISQAKVILKNYPAQATADATGLFQVNKLPVDSVACEVRAVGYVSAIETITLPFGGKIVLYPILKGEVVPLRRVLFETGTATLLPDSYPELELVVEFLKQNPKTKIRVEGHTDARGDSKKNLRLSLERAKQIKMYLIDKEIVPSRIKEKGFGDSRPLSHAESEEARKKNRRVEFVIISK